MAEQTAASSRGAQPGRGDGSQAVRADLAYALYQALGIEEPSSSGRFRDSGPYLDAVTSTLSDLGITTGVAEGQFGTYQPTTRGEAFTMIARALGLADANTDIGTASKALVDAGVVQGYADGQLGLNDPLTKDQLGLLMGRLQPILDSPTATGESTLRNQIIDRTNTARDQARARQDPAYAAFLQQQGISLGQIDDEIALRQELFNEDALRRSEAYQRATEQAVRGVGTDFENRGLFRSGTRLQRQGETRQQLGYQQEQEQYDAQRRLESGLRTLEQDRAGIQREGAQERIAAAQRAAQQQIEAPYA